MGHLPSALDLARSQFAFVVVWHFLFPSFTIGLAISSPCSRPYGYSPSNLSISTCFNIGCASLPSPSPWAWSPAW